jgi:hypothetical protein
MSVREMSGKKMTACEPRNIAMHSTHVRHQIIRTVTALSRRSSRHDAELFEVKRQARPGDRELCSSSACAECSFGASREPADLDDERGP